IVTPDDTLRDAASADSSTASTHEPEDGMNAQPSSPPSSSLEPLAERREAGRELASKLLKYAGRDDVVVLALPRGGVPVAFEIAEALDAPLDIFVVRKLGMPGHPEYAMGAIASGGIRIINDDV